MKDKIVEVFNLKNKKFENKKFSWDVTVNRYQELFDKMKSMPKNSLRTLLLLNAVKKFTEEAR